MPFLSLDKVPVLEKKELIEALEPKQVPEVKSDQVHWLKAEQIKHLNKKEQIHAIPMDRPDLIREISEAMLNDVPLSHVEHFSETQIGAIPEQRIDLIHKLSSTQVEHVKARQVPFFKLEQVPDIAPRASALSK